MERFAQLATDLPAVCRLGLATRGNTHLKPQDVEHAVGRGVNYLNWCGRPDGMSRAIAAMGTARRQVVVAVQFESRKADEAERELAGILTQLRTDYLDIATLYYVESQREWDEIIGPGGAWEYLADQKRAGRLKMIGLTSHQRTLAASWTQGKAGDGSAGGRAAYHLDMLMIRYNAAHRGAEQDVFPVTTARGMPVVTFTGLRWRALLEPSPADPEGFQPPKAAELYRFCLAHPAVSVALMAPDNRQELDQNLGLLDNWGFPDQNEHEAIRDHGDRVHRHAGHFW